MGAISEVEPAKAGATGRPSEMPWISPYLTVRDAEAAVAFYEAAFGFSTRNVHRGSDGAIMHAAMTWHDSVIMLGPEAAYGSLTRSPVTTEVPSPVGMYVYCEDVDALFDRAVAAGVKVDFPPADMFWGDRACKLTDPDGHVWNFATNHGDQDAA